jgi:predicted phage baseplate assembly protein
MTSKSCGCTTPTCGCCEGAAKYTPASVANRPGLPELRYRVGVHGEFFESMKARLATMDIEGVGADGQTIESFRPLEGLTTRDPSDLSIAMLDGWATVADVLSFYQERIANEGYLRTATERRSVLELARLTGYTLRPGVASTVYLAYTLEDKQTDPVEIPIGARSQSIPGPDETPQSFETAEKLDARTEWNNLQVRLSRPQNITLSTVLSLDQIFVKGISTNLRAGDKLLFAFGGKQHAVRVVREIVADLLADRTQIHLQPLAAGMVECAAALTGFLPAAKAIAANSGSGTDRLYVEAAERIQRETLLALYTAPSTWVSQMESNADGAMSLEMEDAGNALRAEIQTILKSVGQPAPIGITSPDRFVSSLLVPPVRQARNSAHLARSLEAAFESGRDSAPQLLIGFEPRLRDTYYAAWRSANVSAAQAPLQAVYALRTTATLFGSTVQRMATFDADNRLETPDQWAEWTIDASETKDQMHLDQIYDTIAPGTPVLIQTNKNGRKTRAVFTVDAAEGGPRTAYGLSGKSTTLTLNDEWWFGPQDSMATLRATMVFGEATALAITEEPVTADVAGQEIELKDLHKELKSGRWVIVSGERNDIPEVDGIRASELMMISALRHGYDPTLANDKTHTTLVLATELAHSYKRETVIVHGNVVKATHGDSGVGAETLGSGDGAQSMQMFTLKRAPLTFVSAPTPSGVESSLEIFVNDIEWHEAPTLIGYGGGERVFVTQTDNEDRSTVIFGNGREGSRLPSGVENVVARYRAGIGKPGNVRAEQISLVQTKPLGVKSVVNPLRASGGADRENTNQARENAPLPLMALDRLVSLRDYEDFTRTFAGIGKASAIRLTDGRRQFIHLTIAGADDIPIDTSSDLYQNLLIALRRFGSPDTPVQVDVRELLSLVLSANIKLLADHQWEVVSEAVRASVIETFGFERRRLGQSALRSELISIMQAIPGVSYVDVDAFGGIPEKRTAPDPITEERVRRLITPDEMTAAVLKIVGKPTETSGSRKTPSENVIVTSARVVKGLVIPAQLAVFNPAVQDTLILNQIV